MIVYPKQITVSGKIFLVNPENMTVQLEPDWQKAFQNGGIWSGKADQILEKIDGADITLLIYPKSEVPSPALEEVNNYKD